MLCFSQDFLHSEIQGMPIKIKVLLYYVNKTAYFNEELASKIWSGQEDQNIKRELLETTCMRNPVKNGVTVSDLHFTGDPSEIESTC